MNLANNIDPTDIRILQFLQKDAKMTIKEIASHLGITTTPVYERIKKMEKDGIIESYSAIINKKKVGFEFTAFCNISLEKHQSDYLEQFRCDIQELPEVIACYHIAGMFDYLLKVIVPDMEAYQNFITKKLASLANVGKVQSSFVMEQLKEERVLPF